MNELLPYNLKDTPDKIFQSMSRGVLERQILANVADAVNLGMPLDPAMRRRLASRSRLAAEILEAQVLGTADAAALVSTPTQAMNAIGHRPVLLPQLLPTVLSNPETAEQLFFLPLILPIAWAESGQVLDIETIIDALQDHPARLLRVLAHHDGARFEQFRAEVLSVVAQKRLNSAAWALEWLKRNPVLPDQPLDSDLAAALKMDEGMACLAMRLLRDRLYDPIVWADLEASISSPRWIYQGLVSGLFIERQEVNERALLADPAWLVEWLVDTRASRDTIQETYHNAAAVAAKHELIGDLHYWFKFDTTMRIVRSVSHTTN